MRYRTGSEGRDLADHSDTSSHVHAVGLDIPLGISGLLEVTRGPLPLTGLAQLTLILVNVSGDPESG